MKLKIVKIYDRDMGEFNCIDEHGSEHIVDMYVDGAFSKSTEPEFLIGKTFDVDRLNSYLDIAIGVNPIPIEID